MGWYDVVASCVVDNRHYIRPTKSPIQVDDGVAAPLVESGCLKPYQPGVAALPTGTVVDAIISSAKKAEPLTGESVFDEPFKPEDLKLTKPPRSRRRSEDHEEDG